MRIFLLTHSFNSLAQRLYVELSARGHELSIEFDVNDEVSLEAVALFQPELIIAPFLKRALPEAIWGRYLTWIVHPGIEGDRGPSSLDWAIQEAETQWGVTLLQANAEMDAGDIWATATFPLRAARKSSIYRHEVTEAALRCVFEALGKLGDPSFKPRPLDYAHPGVRGRLRPLMKQEDRRIDWLRDSTRTILARIRAADGTPGVLDRLAGRDWYLFDAQPESALRGEPGALLGRREGAILRATCDGALWLGQLKEKRADGLALKLPATFALGEAAAALPELALAAEAKGSESYRDIVYQEADGVGMLSFDFYNGAMSTRQCERLTEALRAAKERPTRVLLLLGGSDFWSNGIHLNTIEASGYGADESWANINAMDDLTLEILSTSRQWTLAAMRGNAGAGGVFLALAADQVYAAPGVVLNPHYKSMGNLYGSEYWTYLLPRRVGWERARAIMAHRLPMGAAEAAALGLIDGVLGRDREDFAQRIQAYAAGLAASITLDGRLAVKREHRAADEAAKPLATYRAEELERMRLNFYGFDPSYHVARYNFVFNVPYSRTPLHLAKHRRLDWRVPGKAVAQERLAG
jgi:putative two-component system hydrogenase maturation factor HypX/HoxX